MATILEEIKNDVKLKGFENYNLTELLFYISELDRNLKSELEYSTKHLILKCLLRKVKLQYKKGSSSILFFMNDLRPQNIISYQNVSNLVADKNEIVFEQKLSFSVGKVFSFLELLFSWYRSLKKTNLSARQKSVLLNELLSIKKLDYFSDTVNLAQFKLFVTFYDAQTEGNFMVQKCKSMGVKTATLSHGIILAERDNSRLDYSGIELKGTNSDFFLAWNKFSYKEAVKQGVSESKVKVLGIPQFVKPVEVPDKVNTKVFGIVLENRSGDEFNREMISIANGVARKTGFKYTVRFHPSYIGNEYDDIIDFEYFTGKNEDVKVYDFAKKIEFSIVANSTVFIELIFIKHKVYRYATNTIHDKYKDYPYNSFINEAGLLSLIENNVNQLNELFDELCTVTDVKESYSNFFSRFTNS